MSAVVVTNGESANASPYAKYFRFYLIGANVVSIIVFLSIIIAAQVNYGDCKNMSNYGNAGVAFANAAYCASWAILVWVLTICLVLNIIVCIIGVLAGVLQTMGLVTAYMVMMGLAFLEVIGLTASVAAGTSAGAVVGCVFMLLFMLSLIIAAYMCRKEQANTIIIQGAAAQPPMMMYQQPMMMQQPGYAVPLAPGYGAPYAQQQQQQGGYPAQQYQQQQQQPQGAYMAQQQQAPPQQQQQQQVNGVGVPTYGPPGSDLDKAGL